MIAHISRPSSDCRSQQSGKIFRDHK